MQRFFVQLVCEVFVVVDIIKLRLNLGVSFINQGLVSLNVRFKVGVQLLVIERVFVLRRGLF